MSRLAWKTSSGIFNPKSEAAAVFPPPGLEIGSSLLGKGPEVGSRLCSTSAFVSTPVKDEAVGKLAQVLGAGVQLCLQLRAGSKGQELTKLLFSFPFPPSNTCSTRAAVPVISAC